MEPERAGQDAYDWSAHVLGHKADYDSECPWCITSSSREGQSEPTLSSQPRDAVPDAVGPGRG